MGGTELNLEAHLKSYLLSEIDFVISRIRAESEIRKKLFFFSGAYGAVDRVNRISPHPKYVLLHMALNVCYNSLRRCVASREEGDTSVEIPEKLSETLVLYLGELRGKLEKDEDLGPVVEKFASLSYQTTGSGYYSSLYHKRQAGEEMF
jgi:hypothetical protein